MVLFTLVSFLSLVNQVLASGANPQPYSPIRITFFLTKSANVTEEEFHHHWSTYHAPLVTPWLKRYNILEYNQFHAPYVMKNAIQPLSGPTASIGTYDGYAEFLVESVEVFQQAFLDPYYAEHVRPDEIYLFGDSPFVLSAGYRQVHWKGDVAGVGAWVSQFNVVILHGWDQITVQQTHSYGPEAEVTLSVRRSSKDSNWTKHVTLSPSLYWT